MSHLCLAHRDDLVDLYIEALQNSSFDGTYNATAPNPVRMSELCSSLGRVIGRPSWLPVPEFALQVLPSPLPFACCTVCLLPFSSVTFLPLRIHPDPASWCGTSDLFLTLPCSLPFVSAGYWLLAGSCSTAKTRTVCFGWKEFCAAIPLKCILQICLCIGCLHLVDKELQGGSDIEWEHSTSC